MIDLDRISKIYQGRNGEVKALSETSLHIEAGEFIVIRGPSGSGKTTLLLTIGGMLRPTQGNVTVAGQNVYSLTPKARAEFRAKNIGFVFQMFHLVPYLTVLENVMLAPALNGETNRREEAHDWLKRLGLEARLNHRPAELSAGERQRTALARALINQPKVLLADEPTGNLDPENADEVFHHFERFRQSGGTVVVVTHGTGADHHANRILHIRHGSGISDKP